MSDKEKSARSSKDKVLAILKQLDTKGNATNSLIESFKTAGIGLLGAAAGAAIGKKSLLVGFGALAVAHYFNSTRGLVFSTGIIASGGYKLATGVSGTEQEGFEGAKERVKAFGNDLKERLYLDKFIKPKASSEVSGLGEVQYFKYPGNELNMGSLDALEDEITKSGEQFSGNQFAGGFDEVYGTEDRIL